jgi:uroporphyrinogen decarboxylase
MTSRERVRAALRFEGPDRLPFDFPEPFGSDFEWLWIRPSPDDRPRAGVDEWGAVWDNIGDSRYGEVKTYPLEDWEAFDSLAIPDIGSPERWQHLIGVRDRHPDKFLLGHGTSIYERLHFLRGLENTWLDIYENPENLSQLVDVLADMSIAAAGKFAELDADAYIFPDDWGLQTSLMISPDAWRQIWKPRYARIFECVHSHGMATFMHSCGNILSILDDLIEIGLDAVHMDQQENMGLEELGKRFRSRITFFSPVDIQTVLANGTDEEIQSYAERMVSTLGTDSGGIIPRWYTDPAGAGHSRHRVETMCTAFLKIAQPGR